MLDEDTTKDPASPYGTAKLYAYQLCKNYREAYGMHITNGILFNHESERRGINFVTMKIVQAAKRREPVKLGNIHASRDWGYAPEYMEAAWLMLQQDTPDDYVIATGETHRIFEFIDWVEEAVGYKVEANYDSQYIRPVDVPLLCGDASKAKRLLNWEPVVKGPELAKIMCQKTQ
jgi:GDP-D-mannose dehydratase